ncbi:glycine cleavage system protein R [Candidatus Colwellia aromaticivorans]|uniref:glycine cleavage system protein R n=1 Tax=Candidatus Colwellia aromaticivorans TaxID=2267621 RepID=UPI000DF4B7D0|nr:ACT domain-containing protein [Candidatus Colwellia aromaticivorans]
MNHLVISCIGPDRTGIVDTLSTIISRHNGNWQVSSLHHLSGFFAGVIEVAVDEKNTQVLTSDLKNIAGLSCQIELAEPNSSQVSTNLVLELTANDRAGIVQEISSVIHQQGGNLIKLVSSQSSAPHTGQLMFKAKVQVAMKDDNLDDLISALEHIADDLMVDITKSS